MYRIDRIYVKLFSLFLGVIWSAGLWATEYPADYNLRDIYLESNYIIPSTYSICQDSTGFMWFGTNEGLFRYDGRRLKGYLVTNSDDFIRKRINQIISSGTSLWLSAENELYKFNTINDSLSLCFRNPEGKSNLLESCLDKDGNIWVRTLRDVYVLKPDGDTISLLGSFGKSNKRLENKIGIQVDDDGQVWVLTTEGIFPVRLTNENHIYTGNNLIPEKRSKDEQYREFLFKNDYLFITTKNDVWIYRVEKNMGYFSADFLKHIPDEQIFQEIQQEDLHLVNIYEFIVDNSYNILLDTELGLVVIHSSIQDDASIQVINSKSGQYILDTESMFLDRENNIFVGLGEQGVGYLNMNRPDINLVDFHLVPTNRDSDHSYAVNSLSEDLDGNIWFSSISLGLMRYSPGDTVEHVLHTDYRSKLDISDYKIMHIVHGHGDQLYLATYNGLDAYEVGSGKVIRQYGSLEDPLSNSIVDISVDEWNRIWTIVEDPFGLLRISYPENENEDPLVEDMNHIYFFSKDSSLTRESDKLFYNSSRNELLICQSKGLCKVSFDSMGEIVNIHYYELAKLSPRGTYESLFINDVAFDENPVYYLATNGQGLICIEMQDESDGEGYGVYEAEYITTEEGLRSNFINSVLIDAEDCLWIASRGLVRWSLETGDQIDYSNDRQISETLFLREAALRSRDDRIYFGTTKGLAYIDPAGISGKDLLVQPVISDIRVGTDVLHAKNFFISKNKYLEKEIAYTRELTLKYQDNKFVAEFAGLTFSAPELINFQYMLSGYDEGWIQTRNNAYGSYTNLKPGTYELMVKASGHNGEWNPDPATLTVRILAPWYFHPMAFISYSLLFLAVLFLIIRFISIRHGMQLNKKLYEDRMQLFTTISHELQTPISLIISPLEDLMRIKLPAEATRLIRLVNRNSQRILALNNEMIEIRKYESGNLQVEDKPTEVSAFIRKIAELFVPISKSLGIEYNIIISEEEMTISLDNEKATKIITNLLSNAFKYTDRGGSVSISIFGPSTRYTPNASLNNQLKIPSQINDGDFLTVSILDSGRGIQQADLPKIFSMFFKSEWNINRPSSGFGIGLSIVKNLAQLIGAELVVASNPGIGTEFLVRFPFRRESDLKMDGTMEMENSLHQELLTLEHNILIEEFHNTHVTRNLDLIVNPISVKNILVVEDNLELLDYLAYRLSQDNYRIIKASNGYMALEQMVKNKPDLIITDWKMPRMNGIDLIHNLKSNPETDHIPVIMLTNKFETADNINATISGVDYFIRKPISMEFLLAKIKTILDNRQRLKDKLGRDIYFDVKTHSSSKSDIDFLDRVVKIILDNVDNHEFDSKTICSTIGMSKSPFYSKIKALTGQTPADFIKSIKLKLAARILIEEGVSIQEVTYRIGLENQSFFSQIFKKQFGKSPSEFVKSYAES